MSWLITGSQKIDWDPSLITTALWLDAADSTTVAITNGAVSQWSDKSGNARHATQSTLAKRPLLTSAGLNSKDVITFDGTNDILVSNYTATSNNLAVYAVANKTAAGGTSNQYSRIFEFYKSSDNAATIGGYANTNGWIPAFYASQAVGGQSAPAVHTFRNNLSAARTSLAYNTANITGGILNGSTLNLRHNGTEYTGTTSATAINADRFHVGGSAASAVAAPGVDSELNGYIAEIVVAAASVDLQKIEGYLAHKWGLLANLPNDHPYKTVGPTP